MTASKRLTVLAAAYLIALAGCGGGGPAAAPVAAPASSPPSTTLPASTPASEATTAAAGNQADPNGQAACDAVARISGSDDLYSPDAIEAIGNLAMRSTDSALRIRGQLLIDRAKVARAAKGKSDELSTTLDLGTTATQLATYCVQQGYTKPSG